MPLDFPANPSVNDTYSFGGKTWIWNGQGWQLSAAGAINDIPIGNITPSTGAFTALTANTGVFSGNVTANYFFGNGSQLTGIEAGNVDLSAVAQDIIPAANITYDLGNSTNRWNDIWLANSTIYLGETSISASGQELILPAQVAIGNATIDGSSGGLILPANSTIGGAAVATPRISAIDYPGDDTAADPAGGQTIGVAGSGFQNGASIIVDGTTASVVTFISDTELQFVSAARAAGSYTVYVVNPDGGTGIYVPGMQYSGVPAWQSPPAGSLGEIYETQAIANTFVATSDSTVTYSLFSGTLPPGSSLNSATGTLSGTANLTAGNPVTYNFTIRATDAELQDTDRSFSLTIDPDVITWVSPTDGGVVTVAANVASSTALVATSAAGSAIDYSANALPTGLSLSGNTIAGTATVLGNTSVALTATGNTTTRSSTITVTFVVELGNDPYFNQTVLLLSADASPSFISDASTNSFNITPVGDTRPSAFSPYNTAWSNFFDGTGDYLQIADDNSLDLSADFTIELWFYWTKRTGATFPRLLAKGDFQAANNAWRIDLVEADGYCGFAYGSTDVSTSFGTQTPNQWTHLAVTRSGSTLRTFKNGVLQTTRTNVTQDFTSTYVLRIGAANALNINELFCGNISNLRIVKGTAVYTSNFTPPTAPLTAIAGTSLLTCQSNRFRDAGSNNFAITRNGDVRVTAFAPFADTDTATGSGFFDGTGDYLDTPTSQSMLQLNTDDFTLEFWIYSSSSNGFVPATTSRSTSLSNTLLLQHGSGVLTLWINGTHLTASSTNNNFTLNQWNHIAVCRTNGNTYHYYINGTKVNNLATNSSSLTSGNWRFGHWEDPAFHHLFGYMSNIRIVKGIALYSGASLTVPTSPLTAIAGTSLLTLQNRISYNNSQFVDTSGNRFNITRNGNTTQGTFSPFSVAEGQWSNYFDGSGDYLSIPSNEAFNLGTGDFTFECWAMFEELSTSTSTGDSFFTGNGNPSVDFAYLANSLRIGRYAIAWDNTFDFTPILNQWYHIAYTRSSGTLRVFVNGSLIGSATNTISYTVTGTALIGSDGGLQYRFMKGYLSNHRLIKGTAVYTTNFTPPTQPLTAIAGTSLLTCQSNRFVDNSTNNFTITRNGDVRVTPFSPFAPAASYDPSVNGGSGYFDGSGDYLNGIGTTSSFNFLHNSSALFTLQMWVYLAVGGSSRVLIDTTNNSGSSVGIVVNSNSSNQIGMVITTGSPANFVFSGNSTGSLTVGAWNHVAVTYNQSLANTNAVFYINGVQSGTGNKTAVTPSGSNASFALACGASASGANAMNGYIANLRLDNSIEPITLPTAPLSTVVNTKLLLNFTNGGIIDNTGKNNLETIGNAQISTSVKKYGTGSLAFDGTGDALLLPASQDLALGTGDFTIEMWVNGANSTALVGGSFPRLFTLGTIQGTGCIEVYNSSSPGGVTVSISAGINIIFSGSTLLDSTWRHFAITRAGTSLKAFVDGVQVGSTNTNSTNLNLAATTASCIGAASASVGNFNGYIDDLRITKGIARYTTNFTPPTEPFPQS